MSQHLPTPGKANVTQAAREMFGRMLDEREAEGIAKYGTTLQTWNGRSAHKDLAEELIDAWQYARQAEMERADLEARIADLQNMLDTDRDTPAPASADATLPSHLAGPPTRDLMSGAAWLAFIAKSATADGRDWTELATWRLREVVEDVDALRAERDAALQRAKAADTGLPSNLLGPRKPSSLRESNAILERALAECGEANAAYVAANEALRQRAKAAEARLAAVIDAGAALAAVLPPLMGARHDGHDAGYTYVMEAMGRASGALDAWRAALDAAQTAKEVDNAR